MHLQLRRRVRALAAPRGLPLRVALALLLGASLLPPARAADTPSGAELRGAPTHVGIDGRRCTLAATLRRAAAPQGGGRTLEAVLTVAAGDGKPFPAGIRVTRAWIVVGDSVWEAPAVEEQDAADPAYRDARGTPRNRPGSAVYRVVVRGGPAWDAGTRADVVVRLTDADGRGALLRVPRQTIAATR